MARKLEIDTKGLCLFCLKDCQPIANKKETDGGSRVTNKSESVKLMVEHLKVDTTKLMKTSCVPTKDAEDNGGIFLTLCQSCITESDKFGKVVKQIQDLHTKLEMQIGDLYETIKTGESQGNRLKEFLNRMQADRASGSARPVVVQKFRREIIDKCYQVLQKNALYNSDLVDSSAIDDDVIILEATGEGNTIPTEPVMKGEDGFFKKPVTAPTADDVWSDTFYKCKLCLRAFGSATALEMHSKTCGQPMPKEEEIFKCVHCQGTFSSWTSMQMHTDKCYKAKAAKHSFVKCRDCYKTFNSQVALQSHNKYCIKAKTEKLSVIQCNVCYKNFNSQLALQSHKKHCNKAKTEKLSAIQCNLCYKTFGSSSALQSHKKHCNKAKTEKLSVLPCNVCSKTFGSSSALQSHKSNSLICSGKSLNLSSCFSIMNFKCNMCSRAFGDESELHRHNVDNHLISMLLGKFPGVSKSQLDSAVNVIMTQRYKSSNSRNYTCIHCARGARAQQFALLASLRVHLLNYHFEELVGQLGKKFQRPIPTENPTLGYGNQTFGQSIPQVQQQQPHINIIFQGHNPPENCTMPHVPPNNASTIPDLWSWPTDKPYGW